MRCLITWPQQNLLKKRLLFPVPDPYGAGTGYGDYMRSPSFKNACGVHLGLFILLHQESDSRGDFTFFDWQLEKVVEVIEGAQLSVDPKILSKLST